jgi:hypothetical protein
MTAVAHCMLCRSTFTSEQFVNHDCRRQITCVGCEQQFARTDYLAHGCVRELFAPTSTEQPADAQTAWHPSMSGNARSSNPPPLLRALPTHLEGA